MVLAALSARKQPVSNVFLIVLNDEEEAGYFYHDLTQMLGDQQALFYPSTYRRAVKYAQRDAANEILRTEVLNRLAAWHEKAASKKAYTPAAPLYVVTFPGTMLTSSFFSFDNWVCTSKVRMLSTSSPKKSVRATRPST